MTGVRRIPLLLLIAVLDTAVAAQAFSIRHRNADFDIYRLEQGEEQDLEFFWKGSDGVPYGSIHRLRNRLGLTGRKLTFAINGGIYSEQFTPLGLYIEKGRRYYRLNLGRGGGNFFLLPNGVFYLTDRGARIVHSGAYQPREPVRNALQSGPMLVIDGELHPRFIKGYHSRHIRNGVGVDSQGRVVFAISDEAVNFYDFGDLFKERLDCRNALYLDGSISQMYAPELGRYGGWPWQRFTTLIGIAKPEPTSDVPSHSP